MNPALWVAKTGLDAQQTKLSVVSNNIANVGTTGFKKNHAVFADLMYQTHRQVGGQNTDEASLPSGLHVGTGVKLTSTPKIHAQGNFITTQRALDVAIQGEGFFQIQMPDGTIGYSRAGNFQLDSTGQIVDPNGFLVDPGLTVPEGSISINIGADGTVSASTSDQATPQVLGQIQLARFVNPAGLEPMGNNLFRETASSGAATVGTPGQDGIGQLSQGALESSNVNIAEELVNLIETQRSYETNAKAVETADRMLQFLINNA